MSISKTNGSFTINNVTNITFTKSHFNSVQRTFIPSLSNIWKDKGKYYTIVPEPFYTKVTAKTNVAGIGSTYAIAINTDAFYYSFDTGIVASNGSYMITTIKDNIIPNNTLIYKGTSAFTYPFNNIAVPVGNTTAVLNATNACISITKSDSGVTHKSFYINNGTLKAYSISNISSNITIFNKYIGYTTTYLSNTLSCSAQTRQYDRNSYISPIISLRALTNEINFTIGSDTTNEVVLYSPSAVTHAAFSDFTINKGNLNIPIKNESGPSNVKLLINASSNPNLVYLKKDNLYSIFAKTGSVYMKVLDITGSNSNISSYSGYHINNLTNMVLI